MNDSILKDLVDQLTEEQPMAVVFQDGEVHFPVVKNVRAAPMAFQYDVYPRCKTTPHIEVVKRAGFKAWVSQTDISSVDRKHCIAVIVYGANDTVASMTKDENYAHGFGFGSTEKAFYLLEKAEAA